MTDILDEKSVLLLEVTGNYSSETYLFVCVILYYIRLC